MAAKSYELLVRPAQDLNNILCRFLDGKVNIGRVFTVESIFIRVLKSIKIENYFEQPIKKSTVDRIKKIGECFEKYIARYLSGNIFVATYKCSVIDRRFDSMLFVQKKGIK